jgi:hypothetical protein
MSSHQARAEKSAAGFFVSMPEIGRRRLRLCFDRYRIQRVSELPMTTIEKKPLPPPGYSGGIVTISPSEREDLTNRAQDVINHYMFGEGSWWDAGTRKPFFATIDDLERFKSSVTASEQ